MPRLKAPRPRDGSGVASWLISMIDGSGVSIVQK